MTATKASAAAYRIFAEALELAVGERPAFLLRVCGADAQLQHTVMRLLSIAESNAATLSFAGSPAAMVDRAGKTYGPFRLLGRLGTGGMGSVYEAERIDGVPQRVAVKILRESVAAADRQLFLREARILARLEHPCIARLIDVGVDHGEGWIAIEFVHGQGIVEYCDSRQLDIAARVRLLVSVADAVTVAHRALIVHRDIKPSNVLVTADGQPKLIDFGIAYVLTRASEARDVTSDVGRLFTPHYAAPEQVRGEPVTVATDVFGLGALAYRLLTGQPPYADASSAVGYLLAVTRDDAAKPSVVAQVGADRSVDARRLRGDLDCVILKALERDPARRYKEVQELRDDLSAYLAGRPVKAHPPSAVYRFNKFVRRRKLAVGILGVVIVSLGVGATLYITEARQVTMAQEVAAQRDEFLENLLRSADPREGSRDITVAELLDTASHQLEGRAASEPLVTASMLGLIVDTESALGRYAQGLAASDRQLALLHEHGGSSLDVARALISRGTLLRSNARYADSVTVLRQAEQLLAPLKHVDDERESMLHELAGALGYVGSEREAEAMMRQAIALGPRLHTDPVGKLALAQNDLAVLLGNEGRFAESAAMAQAALATARSGLSPEHPYHLVAEQTMAMALLNLRRPQETEPLLRDIVQRSARVNGPEARDTLIANVQLGETLIELGRYREAQAAIRPAAETLQRVEGPDNRYTNGAWSDYAQAACLGDDAAEGLPVVRRVLATRTRTLAPTDWRIPASRAVLGLCLTGLRRYAEAEPLLLQAVTNLEAARGGGFYATQLAYKALHRLYLRQGRTAEAAQLAGKIER